MKWRRGGRNDAGPIGVDDTEITIDAEDDVVDLQIVAGRAAADEA